MLAEGRVVLLFDGFDELAFRVSYDRVLEHFATVLEAASDRAKVAKARAGRITSATLYEMLIDRWLRGEIERAGAEGADPDLSLKQLRRAVVDLALLLWPREEGVTLDEIPRELIAAAQAIEPRRRVDEGLAPDQLASRSLLVRGGEDGTFTFLHQSVMEWLVAHAAANRSTAAGR